MILLQAAASFGASSPPQGEAPTVKLDLVGLLGHAAWPVKITIGLLIGCSLLVWIIAMLKLMQLGRLRSSERDFERRTRPVASANELFEVAGGSRAGSPGARVIGELYVRGAGAPIERLRAVADRAILAEGQNARALMWLLAFIATGAPFIGLFGTVYGIMDAFIRIGAAKTASLPVVAPAIGEALITTAIGLAAAIPAVFFYNWIDKRVGDYVAELEAAAAEWIALIAEQSFRSEPSFPHAAGSRFPAAGVRQRP
ncbi:MAG TPA: MotA/TolQ/ExbB proton channel family protein [Polyangiaceae bacterium]|nr:MotA/TolQ/ExbB proton channel family protein [Polyangiaceae bacterium]